MKFTPEDIHEAVRKSGYLLEQEVATILENNGFHVRPNRSYKDPQEGKSREMDVWAFMKFQDGSSNTSIHLELICECKNNQYPLLFFSRPKDGTNFFVNSNQFFLPKKWHQEIIRREGNSTTYREIPLLKHLNLFPEHHYLRLDRKSTQFCKLLKQNKGVEATHGGMYESLLLPLISAYAALRSEHQIQNEVWLTYLIIVQTSDLLSYDTLTNEIREVPLISLERSITNKTVSSTYLFDFVTKEYFETFIKSEVLHFASQTLKAVTQNPLAVFNEK